MLIGVDPGGTTGLSMWRNDLTVAVMQVSPAQTVNLITAAIYHEVPPHAIICESYTITRATPTLTQQHDALELIGWCRYHALMTDCLFDEAKPSDSKGLVTDAVLRQTGLYSTKYQHGNDASRQVMHYLARHRRDTFVQIVQGDVKLDKVDVMIQNSLLN